MPRAPRRCFILCICFLVLGVLIGISIDAKFRPNHLRFWVTQVHEIAFATVPGDKIEWKDLKTKKPVKINFSDADPCRDGIHDPCKIMDVPEKATYYYTCEPNCNDPQGGPGSVTQFTDRISDLIENIDALVIQAFRVQHQTTSRGTPRGTSSGNFSTGQTNIAEMQANIETAATDGPIHARISCNPDTRRTAVKVAPSGMLDAPIPASVGQQIGWGSGLDKGFKVTTSDPSPCQEGTQPDDVCTVQASGTYTVKSDSCDQPTSPTETITVPIQAQIYCDTGRTAVKVVPGGTRDAPILASVGQQIKWTSTGGGFSVSMTDASTCKEGKHPPGGICTVQAAGTYTVNAPSCAAPISPSETITM